MLDICLDELYDSSENVAGGGCDAHNIDGHRQKGKDSGQLFGGTLVVNCIKQTTKVGFNCQLYSR